MQNNQTQTHNNKWQFQQLKTFTVLQRAKQISLDGMQENDVLKLSLWSTMSSYFSWITQVKNKPILIISGIENLEKFDTSDCVDYPSIRLTYK